METLTVVADAVANQTSTVEAPSTGASNPIPGIISRILAPVSSAAQAYFWTKIWQEGEARAEADYRAGRFQTFQSGRDAIRYLLNTDED